jgi:hypothetical protein
MNIENINKRGITFDPDILMLELLKQFLIKNDLPPNWYKFIGHVQQRRNSIHAYKNRF